MVLTYTCMVLLSQIDKQKKKKEKHDKQQQKAAEREASRAQLKYSFRVQHMLSNLGDHAKECFRQGSHEAMVGSSTHTLW